MIKDYFARLERSGYAENRRVILNLLERDSSAKVIDFGCSDGSFTPNYQGHKRIFTFSALKELFEYHGFKVERIVGVGYHPFPTKIARILSWIDPSHTVYLTMKVRKEREKG